MDVETANRLMQYRKKAGLSQEELANKLGVSRQAVSKWECAESSPDTDNLIELSKIYGVSIDELINGNPEASKETNNDKEEKKSGIHIKSDKGEVKIDNINIHVKDDDGSEVHISNEGIDIIDNKKSDDVHVEKTFKTHVHFKPRKIDIIYGAISSSIGLIVLVAYLLCGFLIPNGEGWRCYWTLFLLIPVIPSIFKAIQRKKFTRFNYAVAVTFVYLTVGMLANVWSPTWILFVSIPFYYAIFGKIDYFFYKEDTKKVVIDNENVIDNEDIKD